MVSVLPSLASPVIPDLVGDTRRVQADVRADFAETRAEAAQARFDVLRLFPANGAASEHGLRMVLTDLRSAANAYAAFGRNTDLPRLEAARFLGDVTLNLNRTRIVAESAFERVADRNLPEWLREQPGRSTRAAIQNLANVQGGLGSPLGGPTISLVV